MGGVCLHWQIASSRRGTIPHFLREEQTEHHRLVSQKSIFPKTWVSVSRDLCVWTGGGGKGNWQKSHHSIPPRPHLVVYVKILWDWSSHAVAAVNWLKGEPTPNHSNPAGLLNALSPDMSGKATVTLSRCGGDCWGFNKHSYTYP